MPGSTQNCETLNLGNDDNNFKSNSVNDCNEKQFENGHDSKNTDKELCNAENINGIKHQNPNSNTVPKILNSDYLILNSTDQNNSLDDSAPNDSPNIDKFASNGVDTDEQASTDVGPFHHVDSMIKLKKKLLDNLPDDKDKFVEIDTIHCEEKESTDQGRTFDSDSPIKLKEKYEKHNDLLKNADELSSTCIAENESADADSPIKMRKKVRRFSDNLLEDDDELSNPSVVDPGKKESTNQDQPSDDDSPIKMKKKFRRISDNLLEDADDHTRTNITYQDEIESVKPVSDVNDGSPVKMKKKFRRISDDSLDGTDELAFGNKDEKESVNTNQASDTDSPIKLKKKFRTFSEDSQDISEHFDGESADPDSSVSDQKSKQYNEVANLENELSNSEINDPVMEESHFNTMIENSNILADDDSPVKKPRSDYMREVKGKDLLRQSLSLPYFQLPKPDFREYMNETDKRLEEPLLKIKPDSSQNLKLTNKVTLKPADNIVFEIGPPRLDKVEPFRKKVLSMMNRCNGSKSESGDKAKSIPKPIGAERMSWKMKLLNDIAKKKEAALRERNEMLEEALEINEEGDQNMESDTEDLIEDDAVDSNFPVSDTLMSNGVDDEDDSLPKVPAVSNGIDNDDDSLPEIPTGYQNPPNETDKSCENDKEVESSPLCFSLPSFQPQGGFAKSVDNSTSIASNVSIDLSFNESESQKESQSLALFGSSDLLISNPLPSVSQNDEIVYDEVLAKENLLANKHNISRDMITADIMDICSGQFPDEEELPKTPPLINISADEESDGNMSDSNCPTYQPALESDSDSEDDLKFKRKVLNKKIRPISPIDEESRYGEEDTRVHPASVLLEANSNFNFSKNESEHGSDSEGDDHEADAEVEQLNLNYDSEESLIDGVREVTKAPKHVRDYFENEAELSGEEGSSDEDEQGLDGEDPQILDDAEVPENEELRDQIGTLHLKHLLDDDDRMIRQVKNHFLEEGELFSDAARQRKFNWSFNQVEAVHNDNSSGSENEEEISETPFHGDKIKWMQEHGNKETEEEPDKSFDTSFKVGVRRKIATQIVADRLAHSFNKRPRNSFLDEEEAKKTFKKIKLDVTNAQGSRVTKNFVFTEASTVHPSNDNGPVKKKICIPKNSSIDNSVFDLI